MHVTVGICAYNEGLNIGPLLDNVLYKQELPPHSEVLVVCSGCTDNTIEIVQRFAKRDSRVRLYIEKERAGKASAVNTVLSHAEGRDILFVQADTMPHQGCFTQLINRMQDSNIGLVCAQTQPVNNSKTLASKMVQILWKLHDQVFKQLDNVGQARHASEVFCVRKSIADGIPNGIVNDDAFIALVAKKKGWLIRYESESRVSIRGPETISEYIMQRRRVIYGHHQIKKLTGESPQYFSSVLNLDQNRSKYLLKSLVTEHYTLSFFSFIYIEAFLNLVALLDSTRNKSYTVWGTAASTKRALA